MSTKNQSDGRVINFKSGASVKITHPILCEFLDLGHQNPSNNRDKRLRAFTEEKVLPAHRESLQIDEEQFVVTIASLGDQALERMTHGTMPVKQIFCFLVCLWYNLMLHGIFPHNFVFYTKILSLTAP